MWERRAWAAIFVKASFRNGYLHGPGGLHEDLMSMAAWAFQMRGPWKFQRAVHALRDRGPCHMCEMGLGPGLTGTASPELLKKGRNWEVIRNLALRTVFHRAPMVCGSAREMNSRSFVDST